MNIEKIRIAQAQNIKESNLGETITTLDWMYYEFSEQEVLEALIKVIEDRNGDAELNGFECFEYEIDQIKIS